MNRLRTVFSLVVATSFAIGGSLQAADKAAPMTAQELAARLSALQQDGSSYVRLRMEVKRSSGAATSMQIQIKQRRGNAGSEVVYQILFPREQKGEAVLLRQFAGRSASGTLFVPPDKEQSLDAAKMKESLFGTPCVILESKSAKGGESVYAVVKSWIDVRHLVPMRIEKYFPSGQLARRIETNNVDTDDRGRQIPASFTIRRPGSDSITTVEGSRIKHDVNYTDADFTAAGFRNLTVPHS
jgi:hypothetical protein